MKNCFPYSLCSQRLGALSEGQWSEILDTFVYLRLRQRCQQLAQLILCWQTLQQNKHTSPNNMQFPTFWFETTHVDIFSKYLHPPSQPGRACAGRIADQPEKTVLTPLPFVGLQIVLPSDTDSLFYWQVCLKDSTFQFLKVISFHEFVCGLPCQWWFSESSCTACSRIALLGDCVLFSNIHKATSCGSASTWIKCSET